MNVGLLEFQQAACERLVEEMRAAGREGSRNRHQAVVLSAPTGAGKTLIAMESMERIWEGDEYAGPNDQASFLWLSDQPQLNKQTRDKILKYSDVFQDRNVVEIAPTFDAPEFEAGTIYLLNTQKLATGTNLVRDGDDRGNTIWETLTKTIQQRIGNFYVLVDEAHRGMAESKKRDEANSIIQKFIKGSSEMPPAVTIVGISATPARFHEVLGATDRIVRPVNIEASDVRGSGLLKDVITLYHPDDDQPADVTLLRQAAQKHGEYRRAWKEYSAKTKTQLVEPVLVVQVEDGNRRQVSKTNLNEAMKALREELGDAPSKIYAHSFQEGTAFEVDGVPVRYIEPSKIDSDHDVSVVFFKTALNTGWDCPRAEVMMSYRKAYDHDYIAQLIGRMVRTPLTRSIEAYEFLNTVSLFLPHYDQAGITKVVEKLTDADYDYVPPVRLERGGTTKVLQRRDGTEHHFRVLGEIPNYVVPTVRKASDIRRMMKLARLLVRHGIDPDALGRAKRIAVDILEAGMRGDRATEIIAQIEAKNVISVREVAALYGTTQTSEDALEIEASEENVNDLFSMAGRRVGEGLHKEFWRHRVGDSTDRSVMRMAKLETWATIGATATMKGLEHAAKSQVAGWLDDHGRAIDAMDEDDRSDFLVIKRLASEPELSTIHYPESPIFSWTGDEWDRHLYVDSDGVFRTSIRTWEKQVIDEELSDKAVVGWLRNLDRKDWALTIPYHTHSAVKPMYPDFLVLRHQEGDLVIDILDPHNPGLEDATWKARGMAGYAKRHGHLFGRIQLIMVEKEDILRLDLTDERTREEVARVDSAEHLRALYRQFGSPG